MSAPATPERDLEEKIIGEVEVSSRLAIGAVRMRLYLTDQRLIFAHIGKRGPGALATSSLLGKFGGALEDLLLGGRESLRKRKTSSPRPQEILDADKDNFPIGYDDIVRVELHPATDLVRIIILTKIEKLKFSTLMDSEKLFRLFTRVLQQKVSVERVV